MNQGQSTSQLFLSGGTYLLLWESTNESPIHGMINFIPVLTVININKQISVTEINEIVRRLEDVYLLNSKSYNSKRMQIIMDDGVKWGLSVRAGQTVYVYTVQCRYTIHCTVEWSVVSREMMHDGRRSKQRVGFDVVG